MRFSTSAVVLGALAASTVNAASIAHENKFGKRHNHAIRHAEVMERAAEIVETEKRALNALNAAGSVMLTKVGSQTGTNLQAAGAAGMAWLGADGQFTNEFVNQSGEDLVLAIWGPAGSWVNANKPQITVSIPNNSSQVVSFGNNWSGAWSPVYGSTTSINGQIFETWGEATFKYISAGQDYSTVDVSREVNMQGRNMKIVTPSCTSDMNTCVFKCKDTSVKQCMYDYDLFNCAPGSQTGANYGLNFGAPSGGCTGFGAKAQLKTYLG